MHRGAEAISNLRALCVSVVNCIALHIQVCMKLSIYLRNTSDFSPNSTSQPSPAST